MHHGGLHLQPAFRRRQMGHHLGLARRHGGARVHLPWELGGVDPHLHLSRAGRRHRDRQLSVVDDVACRAGRRVDADGGIWMGGRR